MKLNLTLELTEDADIWRVLDALNPGAAGRMNIESPVAAEVEPVDPASEEGQEPELPFENTKEPEPSAAVQPTDVLAEMRAKMKETKTVSLSDGSTASAGDEVAAADTGEVGVVLATFRGWACVELEDGSQARVPGSDLVSVAQEDQQEAPQEAAEVDLGPDEDAIALQVTPAELRDKAREVMAALGSQKTADIFQKVAGVTRISDVPDGRRTPLYNALQAALKEAA